MTPTSRTAQAQSRARRLAQLQADPNDQCHGTSTGYGYGCRCARCRTAKAKKQAEKLADPDTRERQYAQRNTAQAKKLEKLLADTDDRSHGTQYGYVCGCRCRRCTDAQVAHARSNERTAKIKPHQHGTTTAYSYGCRCAACREVMRIRSNRLDARRRENPPAPAPLTEDEIRAWHQADPVGKATMLTGWHRRGYTQLALGRALGLSRYYMTRWSKQRIKELLDE